MKQIEIIRIIKIINWCLLSIAGICILTSLFYMVLHKHVDIAVPAAQFSLQPLGILLYLHPLNIIHGGSTEKTLNYALVCIISGELGQLGYLQNMLYFLDVQSLLHQLHTFNIPGLNPLINEYNTLLCYQTGIVNWASVEESLFRILTFVIQRQINENDVFLLQKFKEDRPLTQFFLQCIIANLRAQRGLF